MASSDEQEMRLCGNCKRDIPLVNFTMHEVHCRRNISLCQKCKEPFPTSEMEEHMAAEHVLVTCKCKMTMEKNLLEEHENTSCPLRLLQCQFCELELAFNKLGDHEEYCGARTERCEKCGSSVMTKDLKDHPVVCGIVPEPKKPARAQTGADAEYESTWFDSLRNRNTFTQDMFSHVPKHVPSRFYGRSVLTRSLKTSNEEVERNRRREQRRENVYEDIPDDLLAELLEDDSTSSNPHIFAPIQHLTHRDNTDFSYESDVPSNMRDDDFWMNMYSTSNVKVSRKLNNFNHELPDDPPQPSLPSASALEDTQLPCEFCEELFPVGDLILHQSGCRLPSGTNNRKSSRNTISGFTENSTTSSNSPAPGSPRVLLPCEFCGIALEADILFHHQDQCEMCPGSEKNTPDTPALPANDVTDHEEGYRDGPQERSTAAQSHPVSRTVRSGVSTGLYTRRGNPSKPPRPARTSILASDQYRQPKLNNFSSRQANLEDLRRRNMEENMRLVRNQRHDNPPARGASERNNGTRSKGTRKNINPGDVDKEE